jgi:hypothetical protein
VNGDGVADIVTGNGSTAEVQVYDGRTLVPIHHLTAFSAPSDVRSLAVNTAVGDVTGDGIADLVLGAGPGGGPLVEVYDGKTGVLARKNGVFAFDPSSRAGISVAVRDFTGDGVLEILVGSGDNGDVKLFDGDTLAELAHLDPFGPAYVGAIFVG